MRGLDMNNFKLLLIEDNDQDVNLCQDSVNEFESDNSCKIDFVVCRTLKEAITKIDMSFDGVIVDIRLDTRGTGDEGNEILELIDKKKNKNSYSYFYCNT